jgi:hypothetical protein
MGKLGQHVGTHTLTASIAETAVAMANGDADAYDRAIDDLRAQTKGSNVDVAGLMPEVINQLTESGLAAMASRGHDPKAVESWLRSGDQVSSREFAKMLVAYSVGGEYASQVLDALELKFQHRGRAHRQG